MKNAPDYAKYSERPHHNHPDEALNKKAWHGTQVFNNCEVFPDEYTPKEEDDHR